MPRCRCTFPHLNSMPQAALFLLGSISALAVSSAPAQAAPRPNGFVPEAIYLNSYYPRILVDRAQSLGKS